MTIVAGHSRFVCVALAIGIVLGSSASGSAQTGNRVIAEFNRSAQQPMAPTTTAQPIRTDRQVQPAALQSAPQSASPPADPRLLAPASNRNSGDPRNRRPPGSAKQMKIALPKIESFTTAGAGLAIVVGLFLVCVWLLRSNAPKSSSQLPGDAVAVLGRLPLAARNFAQLLQVGNKLVLVAITPDGVAPITEITEPLEVQRLLGLCQQTSGQSTSAEFQEVLKHLTKEPASGFLGQDVARS